MRYIDSHTEGEPTRVILSDAPPLNEGSLAEKAAQLDVDYRDFLNSTLSEPRGFEAIVGALLLPPTEPSSSAAVIYYNPTGVIGMCGHGTIGLTATLAHMGRLKPGIHTIETPVGRVKALLHDDFHTVTIHNIESFRVVKDHEIMVKDIGPVIGDIAWGGNWFFLVKECPISIDQKNISQLTSFASKILSAGQHQTIEALNGARIDHVELFGPPSQPNAHSKNFVLCPNHAYDRSPCGTGSSAKLACLVADGVLKEGDSWIQESTIGSHYTMKVEKRTEQGILPSITGRAFVTAEGQLYFNENDPFKNGIQPST